MAQVETGEFLKPSTISPKVFEYLRRITEGNPTHENFVILTFNYFPFNYFVPDRRQYNDLLPSHCVVPCIRFISNRRFHFLGSLCFYREYWHNNKAKFSKDMSECIKLYILALAHINLTVIATVTPCDDIFMRAIQILSYIPYMECYEGIIYYTIAQNFTVVHIHDPAHINYELLNLFNTHDVHLMVYGVTHVASKKDILECLRLDNKPLVLRNPDGKLLDQEESISGFYLTAETSESIGEHIKAGALPEEALGSRLFIGLFREMFEFFYENTPDAKVKWADEEHFSEISLFVQSMRIVKNKTAEVELSQNASKVDPEKSKMVRNSKDIDSHINKQKSQKSDDDKYAHFQENVMKLENSFYSEMCNTPNDIQQNPQFVIANAFDKTLRASSPADSKKKKRKKNVLIPPEIKKELIRARLAAAAEVSQVPPTPTKQKGQRGNNGALKKGSKKSLTEHANTTKLSSPAKHKPEQSNFGLKVTIRNDSSAAGEERKFLTPTKQKVKKSNINSSNTEQTFKGKSDKIQKEITSQPLGAEEKVELKNSQQDQNTKQIQNDDSAGSSKSRNKRRKRQGADLNTQDNPEKSKFESTSNNSVSTDKLYHKDNSTVKKNNNDNIDSSLKVNKSIKENSSIKNFKIPTINIETLIPQPVEDMSEVKCKSPVDLEISEALTMLRGQSMMKESKTELQEQMDEARAIAYEYKFDDLPELVEDSDQEIDSIQDSLIMQDIMDEAKVVYEKYFKKNNIGDSAKEEENKNTIKSYSDKDNSEKDDISDSVEASKSHVKKENKDESKANATKNNSEAYVVPDLFDACESTENKANVKKPNIEESENLDSELSILQKKNIDEHNIGDDEIPDFQIDPNSIVSEVSDLINDSTSTLSKVGNMLEFEDGINDIEIVELPDLIDESDSTFSERKNMNENKANMDRDDTEKLEDINLIRNNSPVSELEDMNDTNASARSNSIEIVEIPDLMEDSKPSMSSVKYTECIDSNLVKTLAKKNSNIDSIEQKCSISFGEKDQIIDDSLQALRSREDVIQDATGIPQINTEDILHNVGQYDSSSQTMISNEELIQGKLLSTEVSTEEVRGESSLAECPNSSSQISTPKETDHTFLKLDQRMPNSETTSETLRKKKEEKEISVEKSQEPGQFQQKNKDENERKHLSPLQTSDHIISPSSGGKKNIKTKLDKVQKLKFDDGLNEKNSEETRISNSDDIKLIDDPGAKIEEALINPETIKSESSVTDIYEKERNLRMTSGLEKIPKQEKAAADLKPTDLISKQSVRFLVREYLTEDEIEEISGTKQEVDTTFTLDSVVQCLCNAQIGDKMKSLQKEQSTKNVEPSKPEENLLKICREDGGEGSIQTVNADCIKPTPKDGFKKTDLRDIDSSSGDSNATNVAEAIEDINKEVENTTNIAGAIEDINKEVENAANIAEAIEDINKEVENAENIAEAIEDINKEVENATNIAEAIEDINKEVENATNIAEAIEDINKEVENATNIAEAIEDINKELENATNIAKAIEDINKEVENAKNIAEAIEDINKEVENATNIAEAIEDINREVENATHSAGAIEDINKEVENATNIAEAIEDINEEVENVTNIAEAIEDINKEVENATNIAEAIEDINKEVGNTTNIAGAIEDINKEVEIAANIAEAIEDINKEVENAANIAEAIEDINKGVENAINIAEAIEDINKEVENAKNIAEAIEDINEEVENATNIAEAIEDINKEVENATNIEAAIEDINKELEIATNIAEAIEDINKEVENAANIAEAIENINEEVENATNIAEAIEDINREVENATHSAGAIEDINKEVENATNIAEAIEDINEEVENAANIAEAIEDINKEVENATNIAEAIGDINKEVENATNIAEAIEDINKEVENATNIAEAIEDINKEVENATNIEEAIEDINKESEIATNIAEAIEDINKEVENATNIAEAIEDINKEVENATNIAEAIEDINRVVENATHSAGAIEDINKEVENATNIAEAIEDINKEVENGTNIAEAIEDINKEVKNATNIAEAIGDTNREVQNATHSAGAIEEINKEVESATNIAEAIEDINKEVENATNIAEAIEDINKEVENATNIAEAIEDINKEVKNSTNIAEAIEDINKEVENLSDKAIGSISDFPGEFDDDTCGLVDEEVKLLADSLDNNIKSGPSKSTTNEVLPSQDEMRKTGAIKKTYLKQPKEAATKIDDYRSLLNFRLFVNKVCNTVGNIATLFCLPYSPEEYLEKSVEECEKFFRERRTVKTVGDGTEVRLIYTKLLRSLLGDELLRTPQVQASIGGLMSDLDNIVMSQKELYWESGSLDDFSVLLRRLWLHNFEGITSLFEQLGHCGTFNELHPDLFKTDHVRHIMKNILRYSKDPSSYKLDVNCLPLDLRECVDTLKPHGSVVLIE